MKYTANLNLKKPELTDYVNIVDLNDNADILDTQVAEVIGDLNTHQADYTLQVPYAVATGTANNYAISLPIENLVAGMAVTVKINIASTGPSTLNWNGKGAKGIKKADGTNATNLKANGVYTLRYDGTSFQLQGEGGEYGTAQENHVLSPYTFGTENGIVTGTMPNRGAISQALAINGSYTIPEGYHNGSGQVTQSITTKGAETFAPSTSTRTIASGQYLTGTQTISPIVGTAVSGDVLSGKTFNSASAGINQTGSMTNRGAVTNTISTQGGQYTIPSGYHNGAGKVTASFTNLVAENIKSGVNVGGVVGNLVDGTGRYQFATGLSTVPSSNEFSVTGLAFQPAVVVIHMYLYYPTPTFYLIAHYDKTLLGNLQDAISSPNVSFAYPQKVNAVPLAMTTPLSTNASGFYFKLPSGYWNDTPERLRWVAFG